ncbi:RlpA-like double-psi beta-barrel-protein domain-containing protein-containing protein [Tuber borchii]|uniref:RlpA-like double-psi beta-barrel-protein domain-containing protein-containing protein n=1 Tax=Tuber borchii TaxID=42251 RepID=A0A2T6ZBP3_TUBBO|nr:RlpA-like double-psi beta-barrel-protein domain-containing protein-containing protein [Tuber borchii]
MSFLFPWTPRRPERAPHDDSLPPFPDRVLNESSEPPVFQVPRRPVAAVVKEPPSDSNSAGSLEKESPTPPARPKFYGIVLPGWIRLRKERYFGLPRRTVILIAVGLLLLLALILGLSIGLTVGKKKASKGSITPPTSSALQTGDGTYYEPGLGACGISSTSSENIVAISHIIFDAVQVGPNPNNNPLCGRKIWVTREVAPGKNVSLEVEVVDRCTGCKASDLDFSLTVFKKLADEWQGRVLVSWAWVV